MSNQTSMKTQFKCQPVFCTSTTTLQLAPHHAMHDASSAALALAPNAAPARSRRSARRPVVLTVDPTCSPYYHFFVSTCLAWKNTPDDMAHLGPNNQTHPQTMGRPGSRPVQRVGSSTCECDDADAQRDESSGP